MNPLKAVTSQQKPSAMFSAGNFGEPRPPEVQNDTAFSDPDTTHLLFDLFTSELNGEGGTGIREATPLSTDRDSSPSTASSEAPSPLPAVSSDLLECTQNVGITDHLDNPFLIEDYDFTEFLNVCDPTLPNSTIKSPLLSNVPVGSTESNTKDTVQFDLSECMHLFPSVESSPETPVLDLSCVPDSELNELFNTFTSNTPETEPSTPVDSPLTPDIDVTVENPRKRSISESDSEIPVAKKSKEEKSTIRRIKNNEASRVSRAKKKQRHNTIFSRVDELEAENERLRVQVEEMEAETARLKKLLVHRLSH